jgi:hypothetical protein
MPRPCRGREAALFPRRPIGERGQPVKRGENALDPPAEAGSASGPSAEAGAGLPAIAAASDAAALAASFEPVPVRFRGDGWTPARQRAFIEHLADTICVATAAERVGMSAESAHRLRRRRGAEGFSAAWDAVLLLGIRQRAVSKAVERALNGTIVRRYYHGQLIAEERIESERLLIWLLEKGERLLARAEAEAIAGDWDDAMDRLERGALTNGCGVWRDPNGLWRTNFPPPPDYGYDSEGEPGMPGYERFLSDAEQEALAERRPVTLDQAEAARDLFFGFVPKRGTDRRNRSKRRR